MFYRVNYEMKENVYKLVTVCIVFSIVVLQNVTLGSVKERKHARNVT